MVAARVFPEADRDRPQKILVDGLMIIGAGRCVDGGRRQRAVVGCLMSIAVIRGDEHDDGWTSAGLYYMRTKNNIETKRDSSAPPRDGCKVSGNREQRDGDRMVKL